MHLNKIIVPHDSCYSLYILLAARVRVYVSVCQRYISKAQNLLTESDFHVNAHSHNFVEAQEINAH